MGRFTLIIAAAAAWAACSNPAAAQFPGNGYWGAYHASNSHYHKRAAYDQLQQNLQPRVEGTERDPHYANYLMGRGLSSNGNGMSAYQGNEYRGRATNMYYGYWDGGFNPGLYGFSMYPHFDRPGFSYWQGGN
ncbi:MAG TPA: hypothetical protein VN699_02365 [Pirellulales bacterium]|nr:hypothetical protein [Pirellulales bacterium]